MSMSVLQKTGLEYLWTKLKSYLSSNYLAKSEAITTPQFIVGDTYDPVGVVCAGLLTGSGKNIYFYIPLPKPLNDSITEITLPSSLSTLVIRHADGGYIVSSGTAISSIGSFTSIRPRPGGVQVTLELNTASTFTNNAPVAVMFNGSTTLSFNGTATPGAVDVRTYYTGTSDPASSLGSDGDIYLKVVT